MPLPAESPPPPRRTRGQTGWEGFRRWLACEESGLLSPPRPADTPGQGCGRRRCSASCLSHAAGEEGLKDTQASGELRLPCSSSCCSLGFLCEPQSGDGRGSLLPGCRTGMQACTFPLCSPGLAPQHQSEPPAGEAPEPPVVSSNRRLLEQVLCPVSLAASRKGPGEWVRRGSAFASSWG